MSHHMTWRKLLATLTDDPAKRQHVAEQLHINPVTITRWVLHKSNPRPEHLRSLLSLFPDMHEELRYLIAKEFPSALQDEAALEQNGPELQSQFYVQVFQKYALLPKELRFSSICELVAQEILMQFHEHHVGMEVAIAKWTVPDKDTGYIRSLSEVITKRNSDFPGQINMGRIFLGIESLAGYAATVAHPCVFQKCEELNARFPHEGALEYILSKMAFPLVKTNLLAGCLLVSTAHPYQITAAITNQLQNFANILLLAFGHDDFQPMEYIRLVQMPSRQEQERAITQERIDKLRITTSDLIMHQAMHPYKAVDYAWKDIEQELLQEASNHRPTST